MQWNTVSTTDCFGTNISVRQEYKDGSKLKLNTHLQFFVKPAGFCGKGAETEAIPAKPLRTVILRLRDTHWCKFRLLALDDTPILSMTLNVFTFNVYTLEGKYSTTVKNNWSPAPIPSSSSVTGRGGGARRSWWGQPYAPAALYRQEDSWYSFLLEAKSTPGQ
jgi:hypothetical protein